MIQLDRKKYLDIFKSKGMNAALTELHLDKEKWELDTFEGPKGFRPDMWEYLEAVRNFSLELWNLSLALESDPNAKWESA